MVTSQGFECKISRGTAPKCFVRGRQDGGRSRPCGWLSPPAPCFVTAALDQRSGARMSLASISQLRRQAPGLMPTMRENTRVKWL